MYKNYIQRNRIQNYKLCLIKLTNYNIIREWKVVELFT